MDYCILGVRHAQYPAAMSSWPLVGRAGELDRIVAVMTGRAGNGLVVTGPAGIGKSRLLSEARSRAEAGGAGVNWVFATPGGIPLLPFAHLLPAADGELTRTLTAAAAHITGSGALVIDDAHLLDPASAALARHLVEGAALPVVLAVRGEGIAGWWRDLERIALEGLTESDTAELLSTALGGQVESTLPAHLLRLSGGNPLLLRELVDAATFTEMNGVWRLLQPIFEDTNLPATIAARLDRLAPAVRAAAELVALAEPVGAAILERLIAPEVIAELESERLLTAPPDRRRHLVALVHPLYGEALRATLPPLRARDHRRRLADAVEAAGARRRRDRVRIAVWRVEAGVAADPALLREAAREASEALDHQLAGRLIQAAVDADGSFESRLALVAELPYLGEATRALELARALETDAQDDTSRAQVLSALARVHLIRGEITEARNTLAFAAQTTADPRVKLRLEISRASLAFAVGYIEESVELADRILQRHPADREVLAALAVTQVRALACAGRTRDAIELAHVALDGSDGPRAELIRMALLQALALDGQIANAIELGQSALEAEATGTAATWRAYWAHDLGQVFLLSGRPATARRWLREALAVMPIQGIAASPQMWGLDALSEAESVLGDASRAGKAMERLRAGLPGGFAAPRRSGSVWARYAEGDLTAAVNLALKQAAELEQVGSLLMASWVLHDAARLGAAATVADDLRRLASSSQSALQALMARNAAALSRRDAAALDEISREAAATGCVLWAAEAASTASLIHRAEGRLGSALASSARLNDLSPACEGARTPGLSSPPAILTRREHEVAGFASRGLSDREIADRLHLSVRTVHSHLYRIYRKLNIEHRSQLPDIISP
ncbi:LuxR family transcriptional regulator [Acrocarpospora macrocephala]|uniref:LuxR family transcriptional regulator n=2 Tax=Acrocarpospora macrocephala TaxID=150177 RepID=A0A5M3WJ08_9ACTN|nr:LuxR family transcriptional regulator [Acrocarpospora macrocephala]